MQKNGWKVRSCANVCGRIDLWHDALHPSSADDRLLLYASASFGGSDWSSLQPFWHGKPGLAAGGGNGRPFKENGKGNTGCGKVVSPGVLCCADGNAVFPFIAVLGINTFWVWKLIFYMIFLAAN